MRRWLGVMVLAAGGMEKHACALEANCSPTVASAVQGFVAGSRDARGTEGYRVANVRQDALRQHVWLLVERCGKPTEPQLAVAILSDPGLPSVIGLRHATLVHIGDEVSVIARSASSQMELHGWAEESGAVSDKIRVRLPRLTTDEDQQTPKILCVVTGVGRAEVVQ